MCWSCEISILTRTWVGISSRSDDEVVEVEVVKKLSEESESTGSAIPILCFPERNVEDTDWTRTDGTKHVSDKNKVKTDDRTRVRQHKEFLSKEVVRIEQDSLLDR